MGKKGLTLLLDEDIQSTVLVEYLEGKGYTVALVGKGHKDRQIRPALRRLPLPLFFTKDKGWLRAGAVPRRHGGIVVFEAGHLDEMELASLVARFIAAMESMKRLADLVINRRFLYSHDEIIEYAPDGSSTRIWPRGVL